MVIAFRHGETDWNAKAQGGGGDAEILRGNIDVPLNDAGRAHVVESAGELCSYPLIEVRGTPNYLRAVETRHLIAQTCNIPERDAAEFAPWDPGQLSGQPLSLIGDILEFLIEVPFVPAPGGGQSFGEYFNNFDAAWHRVYGEYGQDDSKAVVLVLFGNEFRALPAILEGKAIDKYATQKVKPGDYVVIH